MIVKNEKDLEILRAGGKILAVAMSLVLRAVAPGVKTSELDRIAEKEIKKNGGISSFKGYLVFGAKTPYPASLCVSINDEIVHGIPRDDKVVSDGDIVGLDLGMQYGGFFTDMARTVIAGESDKKTKQFVNVGKEALEIAVSRTHAGIRTGDIGYAVEQFVKKSGYGIVRELVGHGVGESLHEDPEIPNWGRPGKGTLLQKGQVIAIEPMITEEGEAIMLDQSDGWTYRTKDGSRSVHFEDTVIVWEKGAEMITKSGII